MSETYLLAWEYVKDICILFFLRKKYDGDEFLFNIWDWTFLFFEETCRFRKYFWTSGSLLNLKKNLNEQIVIKLEGLASGRHPWAWQFFYDSKRFLPVLQG